MTTAEPLDLDVIKARHFAARDGEWKASETHEDEAVVFVDHESIQGAATVLFQADWGELADAEFIAHAHQDVPALIAELEQARRGGRGLGKTVEFLAELLKSAFVRGADDPTGALNMLGNHLAEILESEGGLSAAEFSRVQQALDARETEEELRLRDADERRRAEVSRTLAETTPGGAR